MSADPRDYVEAVVALKHMSESLAWDLFCDEFDARFEKLTAEALDIKTDSITAEYLRQARGRIDLEFTPTTMLNQLLSKTGARADAQLRATTIRPENP